MSFAVNERVSLQREYPMFNFLIDNDDGDSPWSYFNNKQSII